MQFRPKHHHASQRQGAVAERVLVLATVVVLALLNPLLCSLHCFLSSHHAPTTQPVSSVTSFFCDIPDGHVPANESTTAPTSTVTPRAVYDLASLIGMLLVAAMFVIAFFEPLKQPFTTLFITPLSPPPRTAR